MTYTHTSVLVPCRLGQEKPPRPGWMPMIVNVHTGQFVVYMVCPNGHISSLSDHEIDKDGQVDPSVVCPEAGCGFHEWVILDGWSDYLREKKGGPA